jgi:hypothetical protein
LIGMINLLKSKAAFSENMTLISDGVTVWDCFKLSSQVRNASSVAA